MRPHDAMMIELDHICLLSIAVQSQHDLGPSSHMVVQQRDTAIIVLHWRMLIKLGAMKKSKLGR